MRFIAVVSRDGNQWTAVVPDAPGCATCTRSRSKLLAAVTEALEGWLESMLANGDVVAEPLDNVVLEDEQEAMAVPVALALSVALRVRAARARAGLSQAALAAKAGMKQQQIATLEKATTNPTLATLTKVGEALGLTVDARFA